jgi:hypothetical protein
MLFMNSSKTLQRILAALGLICLLAVSSAPAQTLPSPSLNFSFNDAVLPSVSTTDSVVFAVVNMTNHSLVAADLHGTNGSGPGHLGRTLDFTTDDGANSANTVSGSSSSAVAADWADSKIQLGTVTNFTLTFWEKNAEVFGSGDSPLMFEFGPGSNGKSAFATQTSGSIGFAENTSGDPEFWENTTLIPNPVSSGSQAANLWYFYALTYDGSNFRIYEGTESNAVTLVNTVASSGASLAFGNSGTIIFGNRGSDNSRDFPGWLAHWQFYNGTAASQGAVDAIRQSQLPLIVGTTAFSPLSPVYVGTTVALGAPVTNGTLPYSYQWQASPDNVTWTNIPGATSNPFNLNTTGMGGATNYYQLIVTDSASPVPNVVTNVAGALYVSATQLPPQPVANVSVTPSTVYANLSNSVTLSAVISGTPPISYQWDYSSTNNGTGLVSIPGATNSTYLISNAQYANAGYYVLFATNSAGSTNTGFGQLTVLTPVLISVGAAAGPNPPVGTYDIAQLSTAGDTKFPGANALNYYDNNGTKPGQTFTTGSSANGYNVGALYYKCGGPVVSDGSHSSGVVYTLRIYSMSGAAATLISTYTNQNAAPAIPNNVWAQWTGLTNIFAANSTYAYSVSAGSGYMHLGNASNSPAFYNGGLGLFPTGSGTATFATPADTSDATFLVNVVPAGYPDIQNVGISPATSSTNYIYAGVPVTLSVQAIGNGPLTYDWQTDNGTGGAAWTDLPNSNSSVYSLNTLSMSGGTYEFQVIVTNSLSSVTSSIVNLYLTGPTAPILVNNTAITPSGVFVGGSATASASFSGSPTIGYQWYFIGANGVTNLIAGATNATYAISNAQLTNSGAYFLQASNGVAPFITDSTPAAFTVAAAAQNNTSSVVIADVGFSWVNGGNPPVGSNDIYQLVDNSPTEVTNINYYVNNAEPPGQTFTTSNEPPTAAGYPLTSLYVEEDDSSANTSVAQSYTLKIYRMVNGTNAILLTSYTTVNQLAVNNNGDWLEFSGLTNVLQTNTVYGFSVTGNGGEYWQLGNDEVPVALGGTVDNYPYGQACVFPAGGVGSATFTGDAAIDATFIIGLTPVAAPVQTVPTTIVPTNTGATW